MRIGVDLTAIWRPATGMENVAIEMTRALLRADRKNKYVLFFTGSIHPAFKEFAGRFDAVIAPVVHEALLKNFWFPRAAAARSLDFLHFPIFPPPFRIPVTKGWTVADATPWMYPETMKLSSRLYFRILGEHAARNGCLLITDTEAARQDLVRHLKLSPERLNVIYPSVRSIFSAPRNLQHSEAVHRRYGLPERFVLFVGTIEPRKNLNRLLRAFRKLKTERNFEPDLVIVGRKGWLYDSVFSELADEQLRRSVTITGYVPDEDLMQLYNTALLLAYPSLYEGFGLPCVEAMMCGCPVITSNTGALREVTGDAALHVDPFDIDGIADATIELSTNPALRTKLIANGRRRAAFFSWDTYGERVLELIERSVVDGPTAK